ncbi:hypothetical protein [Paractinoplanes rishiriensis]|uniref:Uncharacterized protein n=1 Tax=Paractinoplanes rishiriensis TaxID=1050105 RepID=A0A919MQ62_9ACTN|nr:hypothetical protein [Actinoplanes rishiriensis]GIE95811.1 hypothetical protein Ari01nite_32760 [Actinoplanes rishiriensis]
MKTGNEDPVLRGARRVADTLAGCGYAFIEDDQLDGLAAVLRSFLTVARIPVNSTEAGTGRLTASA